MKVFKIRRKEDREGLKERKNEECEETTKWKNRGENIKKEKQKK
jgi:hypothetical protein